jgi:hypothetical protein
MISKTIIRNLKTLKLTYKMSSRKRRKETKKIKDSYPTKTLKELEDEGVVPKNFHLFDRVDMKEYQLQTKTDWWSRMSKPT